MPPQSAAARARMRHATRPRAATRPAAPRRVSGPLRPAPAGAPLRRGSTGVFERLRALPETRVVDGLLRGRAWIWLIGIMLGGIVAMQVSLLKLNAGISRAVTTAGTLERQNADIEAEIGRLSNGRRVRDAALADGMITPAAGAVGFLTARERDAKLAANRMVPPSDEAAQIMQNGGREPGVLAATPTQTTAVAPETTDSSPPTIADPTGTATATATPVPTPTPEPTLPAATTDGAAVAPQG